MLLVGWVLYRAVLVPNAFTAAVGAPDEIILLEGLPHPRFERRVFEQERDAKPTRELYGYSFYEAELELSSEDARTLTDWLADTGSYTTHWPLLSAKMCGGFHPDYAVEFHEHGHVYYALLCFGCGEVELHGGWIDSKQDLARYAQLKALLSKYRKNRPERERMH